MQVEKAAAYDPLHDFSCGEDEKWETDLNSAVRALVRSEPPRRQVHVLEDRSEDASDEFIGVASFVPLAPGKSIRDLPPLDDAIYISALGITQDYRGAHLPDGSRVGGWLLDRALERIRVTWANEARPIWALVHKHNERCWGMLRPRDFVLYPVSGNYDVWVRSRDAARASEALS
jgi:hypothetical protein